MQLKSRVVCIQLNFEDSSSQLERCYECIFQLLEMFPVFAYFVSVNNVKALFFLHVVLEYDYICIDKNVKV